MTGFKAPFEKNITILKLVICRHTVFLSILTAVLSFDNTSKRNGGKP